MKSFITTCLTASLAALALSTAAIAASPEQGYIAARDKYLAQFKPYEDNTPDKVTAEEARARKDLAHLLAQALGPVGVKGFSHEGKLNQPTLLPGGEDSDAIDGLVFKSDDGKTDLLLTTRTLMANWLSHHQDTLVNYALEIGSKDPIKQVLFEKQSPAHDAKVAAWLAQHKEVAQDVDGFIASELFYGQMFDIGSAAVKYAEVAVTKPASAASVTARLIGRQQDVGPYPPDGVVVTLVQGERVYVLRAKPEVAVKMIPECTAIWTAAEKQRTAAFDAVRAAQDKKDKKAAATPVDEDAPEKIEAAGDKAFHRCFAEKASTAAFMPPARRQAQALVDRVGAP